MSSKREQIKELLKQLPRPSRAEIARVVGVNYQTVRNVEDMMERTHIVRPTGAPNTRTWSTENLTKRRR